jgi:hypothetical protein
MIEEGGICADVNSSQVIISNARKSGSVSLVILEVVSRTGALCKCPPPPPRTTQQKA